MESINHGKYKVEKLYVTRWYERPIQGIAVLDTFGPVLFDSYNFPFQKTGYNKVYSPISPEEVSEIINCCKLKKIRNNTYDAYTLKSDNPAMLDEAFHRNPPLGNCELGKYRFNIISSCYPRERSMLIGRWRLPPEERKPQVYPEELRISVHYIFDWYDGLLQGLLVLDDFRYLLYELYKNPESGRLYAFGELTDRAAIDSLTNKICGHHWGWEPNMFTLQVSTRKVRAAFNTVDIEHLGVMGSKVVPTLIEPLNILKTDVLSGWGGNQSNEELMSTF